MKAAPSHQKRRGGYYTPPRIAEFLACWAIRSASDTVLEPSCGDGAILAAAVEALRRQGADPGAIAAQVLGVECDPAEAAKAVERLGSLGLPAPAIQTGDFFAFHRARLAGRRAFDVVVGNPPFIRYQSFPEEHRASAFAAMREAGLHPNRLTNAWAPFLVASAGLVRENGRLAMVIPAELFQVSYAAEIRRFLSDAFHRITLLTFRRLVFDDIQQEVVLLLGERDGGGEGGIRTVELDGLEDLEAWASPAPPADLKPLDHSCEKWTQYFLDREEILLLRELRAHPGITISGDVLQVDVGVVTGENSFFVLAEQAMRERGVEEVCRPIVTRSSHLAGASFSTDDHAANAAKQYPAFLFLPPDAPREALPERASGYIEAGEREGVHTGFKCRNRRRWYVVPSVWVPQAFLLRQVHAFPKLVLNGAGATCTDTLHRARLRDGRDGRRVAAAFHNSLTFAYSEVTGRSYGGGVLTFEPSEMEALPLPLPGAERLDLDESDALLRAGRVDALLDLADAALLRDGLGLGAREIAVLRGIWAKLRDRRLARRR